MTAQPEQCQRVTAKLFIIKPSCSSLSLQNKNVLSYREEENRKILTTLAGPLTLMNERKHSFKISSKEVIHLAEDITPKKKKEL